MGTSTCSQEGPYNTSLATRGLEGRALKESISHIDLVLLIVFKKPSKHRPTHEQGIYNTRLARRGLPAQALKKNMLHDWMFFLCYFPKENKQPHTYSQEGAPQQQASQKKVARRSLERKSHPYLNFLLLSSSKKQRRIDLLTGRSPTTPSLPEETCKSKP